MIEVARYSATTTARLESVWRFYAQVELWSQWDKALAWSTLDGSFKLDSTGIMKPKIGPKVSFTLTSVKPRAGFSMTSKLLGCTLTIHHDIKRVSDHEIRLTHYVTMEGPLQWLWSRLVSGKQIQEAIEKISQLAKSAPDTL